MHSADEVDMFRPSAATATAATPPAPWRDRGTSFSLRSSGCLRLRGLGPGASRSVEGSVKVEWGV